MVIDWGGDTAKFDHLATNSKPIVSIQANAKKVFSDFENLILTYDGLKEIVKNEAVYDSWHTALSSINTVYLIVDRVIGKQYVRSAYGQNGLLGRWTDYVISLHGNNKLMMELLDKYSDRYHHFQFSVLQILPKTVTNYEVIKIESLYKRKLLTIGYGLNDN
ncbi:MAG: GIY-YIG nuclease family protein [Candidatus Bruticola sp.]